jgi:hypothetical protein
MKLFMKRFLIGAALCLLAVTAVAVDDTTVQYDTHRDRTLVVDRSTTRNWVGYECNEVNFSAFGTGTVGRKTLRHPSTRRIERDGKLGAGTALSYFFHRNFGVETYLYTESVNHYLVDNVGADLIARLPLGESGVALYAFGGGARQFDPIIQWTWDAGGGIEWRFLPSVGVFADARYVWADKTKDYGLGRLGVKFGF